MNRRRGFTLMEVVAASCIATIVLMACASVVLLAAKSVPNPNDTFTCALNASRVADQIAGELESAILVLQSTPTSITFAVPPRNSDVYAEKISYTWAGTSGAPLLRQYNSGTPVAVLDAVDQFNLTTVPITTTESYPGIGVEDANESLLIDDSALGFGSQNVNATTWQGQYFASNSWPAGVVGWRPTRIVYEAKQSSPSGVANAQMYLASINLTPAGAAIEQYSIAGSSLPFLLYGAQSVSYSHIGRLAPATGACFVIQGVSGSPYSLSLESNFNSGCVQTTNSGTAWAYQGSSALVSQLYGKLTRSSTTQYATSTYLEALQILLRAGPTTNQSVQTTALMLNHPAMLSAYWEINFASDPTKLDVNADGIMDWTVHGGGTFNVANLNSGVWQPNGVQLDSQPGNNFAKLTVVDLRLCATTTGSWAGFIINAARSGSVCAPILGQVALQSDGTQTVTITRKLNDLTSDPVLIVTGVSAGPVDLHLIIDPNSGTVGVCINTVEYGSFAYNSYSSGYTSQSLSLTSSGNAQFSYARLREMQ